MLQLLAADAHGPLIALGDAHFMTAALHLLAGVLGGIQGFISLLIVLPALDVVILGKDRVGEGEGKGYDLQPRAKVQLQGQQSKGPGHCFPMPTATILVASQVTLSTQALPAACPRPLAPNPCPESLLALSLSSLFLTPHPTLNAAGKEKLG